VLALPLDGNPSKSMGLIAHPGQVAAIAVSRDGKTVVTAGGADASVCVWTVNAAVVARMTAVESDVGAYLNMVDGGADGEFAKEMQDFFIYCQIHNQGEDSMSPRYCGDSIALSSLPNWMRALGYYPTELEIDNLLSEVRYSGFGATGRVKEEVTLSEAVRLYVNHRPVLGTGKAAIANAVQIIAAATSRDGSETDTIPWRDLVSVLTSAGEPFGEELDEYLLSLTGEPLDEFALLGSEHVGAKEITQDLLGFEES